MRVRWVLAAVAGLLGIPLGAQVVRGVVRDTRSGAPIPGVLVSLEVVADTAAGDAEGQASLARSVLSDDHGEYTVRAGTAGRWIVSARRVGLRRWVSAPFDLGTGETRRLDITLAAIDFTATLPVVAVSGVTACDVEPGDRERIAALWDEARTALVSAQLALRDRRFTASVVRYTRELAPVSLRVLREELATRRGVAERAFVSESTSLLSSDGYVRPDDDGGYTFSAPDAEVLTSTAFVREHCFGLGPRTRARPGLSGLAFRPTRERRAPDIEGTVWLDSATHALRLVEFRYVNLPEELREGFANGEVQFGHLDNGTWYVSKWYIRTPVWRAPVATSRMPVNTRPELAYFREHGGDVALAGRAAATPVAKLAGVAMDSTGRVALRGATVRLAGISHRAPVRPDGTFTLDSLRAGAYTLELVHPDYDALGVLAAEQDLDVSEGRAARTAVQALGTRQVLRVLCGFGEFGDRDVAAIRVRVTDSTNTAVPGAMVHVRYTSFDVVRTSGAALVQRPILVKLAADANGVALFCDVPARQPVRIEVLGVDDKVATRHTLTLPRHALVPLMLRR
ncbi:MAG: carboxypeptidase regulatory-like domain-containing protein [Gemmatimonadaceae bacterium]|nr:carboxypeptidase regulatory-like domain-containing protein [Gemmatimonadaceae bacterium]